MNKDSFFIIFLAVSLAVHGVALAFIKPIKPMRYTEPKEIEIMPFELPDDPEPPARVKENKPVFEEKKAPPPPPEEQRVETPRIAPEPLKPEKQEPPKDDRKTEPDKQPAEPPRGVEGAFPEKIKMSSAADNGSSADNVYTYGGKGNSTTPEYSGRGGHGGKPSDEPPAERPRAVEKPASREAPPAPKPAVREPEKTPPPDYSGLLKNYQIDVITKIQRNKKYPRNALDRGTTGVTKVKFTIGGGGAVSSVEVAASSGSPALDDEAVSAVRRAAPFSPIPRELDRSSLTMTVSLRFEIR